MQLADLCVQMETNNDDENMRLENDNKGVQMEYKQLATIHANVVIIITEYYY